MQFQLVLRYKITSFFNYCTKLLKNACFQANSLLSLSFSTSNKTTETFKCYLKSLQCFGSSVSQQWCAQKILMGRVFIQWHMAVISIWRAPFVTSQFDVVFIFTNQRFDEVC